jgi:hypothetical protein
MPEYVTYIEVTLDPEGPPPEELTKTLGTLGWKPVWGRYDYAYKWNGNWNPDTQNINDYFTHITKIHEVLKGHKVNYSLRTYESGTENFWVKWSE